MSNPEKEKNREGKSPRHRAAALLTARSNDKISSSLSVVPPARKSFSYEESLAIGNQLGVNWKKVNAHEFYLGMNIELEHGRRSPETNITNDDPILTAKITLAHLKELKDYNTRLQRMEHEINI
jgi:hypothetical protein